MTGEPLTATPATPNTVGCTIGVKNSGAMQGYSQWALDTFSFQNARSPDAQNVAQEVEFNNGTSGFIQKTHSLT